MPIVHYARNLLGMVGANKRKELAADLRAIFAAPVVGSAHEIASSVAQKWRQKGYERVSEHLEEQVEEWLTGRRYLDMRELEERRREEGEANGVILMEG